jgi:hypothetical protein
MFATTPEKSLQNLDMTAPTALDPNLTTTEFDARRGLVSKRNAIKCFALILGAATATTAITSAAAPKKRAKAKPAVAATIAPRLPATSGNGITPPIQARPVTATKPIASPAVTSVTPRPTAKAPVTAVAPPPAAAKGDCRLMPLGDSLTAFPDSYRGPLYRTLKAEGLKVDFVGSGSWEPTGGGDADGEGHGGFRIGPDDGVDYQNKPTNLDFYIVDWLKAAKPQVILLAIGTNDLAAGGPIADAAAGKLQNLVAKIRQLAPDAYLVLSDIPPATNRPDLSPTVQAVDEVARKLGNGSDPKISYGETAKNLLALGFSTPVHTSDGTHFTAEGGVLFAKAWYPKARAAIKAACGI